MPDRFALQPAALEPSRARLAALQLQLAARETELTAASDELQQLQAKYLKAVGGFYRKLVDLEAAIVEAEIAAGLRVPAPPEDAADTEDTADVDSAFDGCSNRGAASTDLKAMYRNLAKTIHPDLALDDPARMRRHSLMAEANRAYAERDEDRLRLILHTFERSPDSVLDDDGDADESRLRRRVAMIEDRLLAIDAEFAGLHSSAIWQLKKKIDTASAQGWDLFAEMVLEVKREVRRATARLASLRLGNTGAPNSRNAAVPRT
jgi:hypothetical protein